MVPAARVRGGWIRRQAADHAPHRLSKRYGANSGLGDKEAKRLLKNWMGELAIVHARRLARCLNSRAARCVYETAVRNGKARGHGLPPSLREIDEFY